MLMPQSSFLFSILSACVCPPLFVCLWMKPLQGVVASRQLTAGVGRERGMRNVCELEERDGGRGAGVALGISVSVSCQQAEC